MDIVILSILAFIATSIDYLVVLTILFSTQTIKSKSSIYFGQYIGTAILVAFSMVAASVLGFLPEQWMIGFLGLIPLFLGIRSIFVDEDVDEDEIEDKLSSSGSDILAITALTIALGGDNLGVYIPFFTGQTAVDMLVVIIVFAIGIFLLCYLSSKLASIPAIESTVEKYENIIVPVVFIGLGIYIMLENGTLAYLLQGIT